MSHLRRLHLPALLMSLALLVAACSGGNGSSAAASAGGNGDSGCDATGTGTLTVTDGDVAMCSNNLEFDADTIEAPANEEFTITFTNAESAPHNVAVYVEEGGEDIVIGEVITGPDATTQVVVPALDPGTYYFRCDVHPEMEGTIVVGG